MNLSAEPLEPSLNLFEPLTRRGKVFQQGWNIIGAHKRAICTQQAQGEEEVRTSFKNGSVRFKSGSAQSGSVRFGSNCLRFGSLKSGAVREPPNRFEPLQTGSRFMSAMQIRKSTRMAPEVMQKTQEIVIVVLKVVLLEKVVLVVLVVGPPISPIMVGVLLGCVKSR